MRNVKITGGGILDVDGNPIKNLRYHYGDEVHIEDGLTVLDLFNVLGEWISVIETDFISETGGWDIRGFFDQVKMDSDSDMEYKSLNFEWVYESWTEINLETGLLETDLDHYLNIYIMGIDGYTMMFEGLNNLGNLPIVLVKNSKLTNINIDTGESKDILEFQRGIYLRELISALMSEITFFGDIDSIKKAKMEFQKDISAGLDDIKVGNLISLDDMELDMLSRDLNRAVSQENYEWAQRIKDKMDLIRGRGEKSS